MLWNMDSMWTGKGEAALPCNARQSLGVGMKGFEDTNFFGGVNQDCNFFKLASPSAGLAVVPRRSIGRRNLWALLLRHTSTRR